MHDAHEEGVGVDDVACRGHAQGETATSLALGGGGAAGDMAPPSESKAVGRGVYLV